MKRFTRAAIASSLAVMIVPALAPAQQYQSDSRQGQQQQGQSQQGQQQQGQQSQQDDRSRFEEFQGSQGRQQDQDRERFFERRDQQQRQGDRFERRQDREERRFDRREDFRSQRGSQDRQGQQQAQQQGQGGAPAGLGVSVEETQQGIQVIRVHRDSPAEQAGLQEGDVIQSVNNQSIRSVQDLVTTIRQMDPGDQVDIQIQRGNRQQTVNAQLETRGQALAQQQQQMRGQPRGQFGPAAPWSHDELSAHIRRLEQEIRYLTAEISDLRQMLSQQPGTYSRAMRQDRDDTRFDGQGQSQFRQQQFQSERDLEQRRFQDEQQFRGQQGQSQFDQQQRGGQQQFDRQFDQQGQQGFQQRQPQSDQQGQQGFQQRQQQSDAGQSFQDDNSGYRRDNR